VPPKIPPLSEDELESEHREMLANLPPLNVFPMVVAAPCNVVSRFLESTRVEVEDEPSLRGQTPDSFTWWPGDPRGVR
jgi:hypothetical protein